MLPKHLLVYTLLPAAGMANCITQEQQVLRNFPAPFTGENNLDLVPLNETAGTGIVPIDAEQTILRCKRSPKILLLPRCRGMSVWRH